MALPNNAIKSGGKELSNSILFGGVLRCLVKMSTKNRRQYLILIMVLSMTFLLAGMQQIDFSSSSLYHDTTLEADIPNHSKLHQLQQPKEKQQRLPPLHQQQHQQQHISLATWRNSTRSKCQAVSQKLAPRWDKWARRKKQELEEHALSNIVVPSSSSSSNNKNNLEIVAHHHPDYDTSCKHAFIDLGTNIGDTIGYFIDNAIDVCTPIWKDVNPDIDVWSRDFPRPRLNVTSLEFRIGGTPMNHALDFLRRTMSKLGFNNNNDGNDDSNKLSEMCVYGMEGNPLFTERLQRLEQFLWQTNPRFFKHLHIHTEHVIAKQNGHALLYLDQVSTKKNFWGSSILDSLTDAKKTADLNGGEPVATNVTAINLSTLLTRTMAVFQKGASPADKTGGKLIIKMDVEGAEYQVLKEVRNSGTLCDYIKAGNQVIMLVEFHTAKVITNKTDFAKQKAGTKKAKADLEECGVVFEKMGGNWDY